MADREFSVGDEVYLYESSLSLIDDFLEGKIIKGKVISYEYYDYGYHGSGDWICDYTIKGEDGKEYLANYKHGYKKNYIMSKEEVIERVTSFIAEKEESRNKTRQELSQEAIVDYIVNYINSKKRIYRNLNKEINTLNKALEEFKIGESKGMQYKKGKR